MQTMWPGLTFPSMPSNLVGADGTTATVPWSVPVVLQDPPVIPTAVHLPSQTLGVLLWATEAQVAYGLDQVPTLPPDPAIMGPTIPATAFGFGGVLLPNLMTAYSIPDPDSDHILYLLSATPFVQVLVQALREPGAL